MKIHERIEYEKISQIKTIKKRDPDALDKAVNNEVKKFKKNGLYLIKIEFSHSEKVMSAHLLLGEKE